MPPAPLGVPGCSSYAADAILFDAHKHEGRREPDGLDDARCEVPPPVGGSAGATG
jgi:hypothetical protein